MPFEYDGVRVPLAGYFISPRDETEAEARPLTLSSAGGLDWTSAGMVPWVMPLVEEGFNVLIYEGPGQGDTLRIHNYAFIPEWDRVMKAVYDFAASSDLPWDRSRGVGHGTASFAGQLGLQACLRAGEDVGVTACYMSPTTASDSRVLGGLVWDGTMDVTRAANYLKDDHPEVFRALSPVTTQYSGYSSDGRIYGADPLVAGLLTCGATGHDALTYPDYYPFKARANAPMSYLGGDELLSLHGDYWLYALAASEIKRKGWTIAEVMLDDEKKLAMANYAGLRLLTEFKMEEEEVREPRATRNILLMGSTDDSMFSYELVHHIYDALPEASRAAATVNVYDEGDGGALHCREGAITKSQYTVVAPFLAAALGEGPTDAPTPGGGSDGADGRSHAVLLWTAVFLLLF